jgi:hypothetical protein
MSENNEFKYISNICFMPDGQPAPEVLSEQEVIKFLRLDEDGKGCSYTLKYYRDKNLLKGIQIGKNLRYTKQEVLNFLALQTERSNKRRSA